MSKFKDFCTILPGYAFKSDSFNAISSTFKALKITDIEPPFVVATKCQNVDISESEILRLEKYKVTNDDYVMAMTGATIGKVGRVINADNYNIYINQRVCKFIPKTNCDKSYLYYVLTTDWFKAMILSNVDSTSAQPNIGHPTINEFEYILPDIKEQRKIANVLSALDKKIEVNNKIIKELESMAKELYDYWFVQFDFPDKDGKPYRTSGGKMTYNPTLKREIPLDWEVKTLLDIATFTNGLACQNNRPKETEESLRVIKIKEMHNGFSSDTEFVSANIPEKVRVYDGDVLFSWSASLEVMIWAYGTGGLNQHIFKVTSDNYPREYYYYQLLDYVEHFQKIAEARKTTMGHITQEHLQQSRIVVPSEKFDIISKFEKQTKPIVDKIVILNQERIELAELRDWLLPMLMNGQIAVSTENNSDNRIIPVDVHIIGGHIVKELYGSAGWGRTKLQKALHLVEYHCQLNLNSQAVRQTAGPFDSQMMNTLDTKFKQFGHVVIRYSKDIKGRKRYDYIPTAKISEIEYAFDNYSDHKKLEINNLLSKLKKMDLQRAEVISTLYAVWNNRIIKNQEITDDLLLDDFYAWSPHKSDFNKELVLKALMYMRKEDIVPKGWGRYIDKV